MYDSKYKTYLIFLDDKYFKKTFFGSIYKIIRKNLKNKGIKTISIEDVVNDLDPDMKNLTFDDKKYPDTNVLYIHLFNGQYYNDSIYSKKKTEKEREMLLLIAGKLGVKELTYSTEITETKIKKINGNINVKSVQVGGGYEKIVENKIGLSGKEIYSNRGAPVCLTLKNIDDVYANIKETISKMKSNVFSYNYFVNNQKLESFVHKRFVFKMITLQYTIEQDDIADLSFSVKSCFSQYGISLDFNETIISREKINYTFEFFSDDELTVRFNQRDLEFYDEFVKLRYSYDNSNQPHIMIHHIADFVLELAKKCFFIYNRIRFNYWEKLNQWIVAHSYDEFIKVCETFYSSAQIKSWIYTNLTEPDMRIIYLDKYNHIINSRIDFESSHSNSDLKSIVRQIDIRKNNKQISNWGNSMYMKIQKSSTKQSNEINNQAINQSSEDSNNNSNELFELIDIPETNEELIELHDSLEKIKMEKSILETKLNEVICDNNKLTETIKQLESDNNKNLDIINLQHLEDENKLADIIKQLEFEKEETRKGMWGCALQSKLNDSNDSKYENLKMENSILEAKLNGVMYDNNKLTETIKQLEFDNIKLLETNNLQHLEDENKLADIIKQLEFEKEENRKNMWGHALQSVSNDPNDSNI
jgi:hypothetical protein